MAKAKKASNKKKPVVKAKPKPKPSKNAKPAKKAKIVAKAANPKATKQKATKQKPATGSLNQFLSPLDDRVVVIAMPAKPISSLLYVPESTESQDPRSGDVVAVGPGARDKKGQRRTMALKKGDRILFQASSWNKIILPMGEFFIVKESEVYGILESK